MVRPGPLVVETKTAGARNGPAPSDRWIDMKTTDESGERERGPTRPSRIVLVGARRAARRLVRGLSNGPWSGPPIVGFVDAAHPRSTSLRPRGRHLALHHETDPVPVLGSIEQLDRLVDRARATHVVVAVSAPAGNSWPTRVGRLLAANVAVHWVSVDSQGLDLDSLPPAEESLSRRGRRRRKIAELLDDWDAPSLARSVKRMIDLSGSLLGLLLLAPLFLAVAVAILVTTGRPIFYSQERIGQGGRRFRILKFRSMRPDAERESGPIWASIHDERCTKVGDWLRRTNIDELPQLLNVLKGEMSLVGPRPERPSFVERFRREVPDYHLRHAVPGGMTGWAQVHGFRGRTSLRKRLQYDLDYIERWTIGMDVKVLLMTIEHVLWGKTSWKKAPRPKNPPA